jgi:chemotaxis protein MotB
MRRATAACWVGALLMLASSFAPTMTAAIAQTAKTVAVYRTQFFGMLREALAGQRDVQIVGDRFVIQSDVLFQWDATTLRPGGERLLLTVAQRLIEFSPLISRDTNWVLVVDGHTDTTPPHNSLYPSNWDLSTARAITVVKFLHRRGVPNDRLVVSGYSQYQPLSTIDQARNRRIELRLIDR